MDLELAVEKKEKTEDCMKFLQENLRTLLKENHLNANQLASILQVPAMTISRLLSGQTMDPRISTVKMITDYFNVSIDSLVDNPNYTKHFKAGSASTKPLFVPLLDWDTLINIQSIHELDLNTWHEWQPIPAFVDNNDLSNDSFALITRPSMSPRYRLGTVLIIDPHITPIDGDIVLIKIKNTHELTLRELIVDSPDWQLRSIVQGSTNLKFSSEQHHIMGVNRLTMSYNKR